MSENHEKFEKIYWTLSTIVSLIAAVGATFSAWFAFGALKASQDAADQARRQADIALDSVRPWLTVKININGPVEIEIKDREYARVKLSFEIKNIGRTPALNHGLHFVVKPEKLSNLLSSNGDFYCENPDITKDINKGPAIFPDMTYEKNITSLIPDDTIKTIANKDEEGRFWFHIVGCVVYESEDRSKIRMTPFAYILYKQDNNAVKSINPFDLKNDLLVDTKNVGLRELNLIGKGPI